MEPLLPLSYVLKMFVVNGVNVYFPVISSSKTLSALIRDRFAGISSVRNFHALKDINLQLPPGEKLGLLGHNGAGKTTLLRVLGGILVPNTGTVCAPPNIGMFIGSGQYGDQIDATGLENIEIACMLEGLPQERWESVIKDIEIFTELGDFLNNPVRTYSAGMLAKLRFALATGFEREHVIIDEGIGAGDQFFREKAVKRIEKFLRTQGNLILASHNVDLVSSFCNRCAVMTRGSIEFIGPSSEAIQFYENKATP